MYTQIVHSMLIDTKKNKHTFELLKKKKCSNKTSSKISSVRFSPDKKWIATRIIMIINDFTRVEFKSFPKGNKTNFKKNEN